MPRMGRGGLESSREFLTLFDPSFLLISSSDYFYETNINHTYMYSGGWGWNGRWDGAVGEYNFRSPGSIFYKRIGSKGWNKCVCQNGGRGGWWRAHQPWQGSAFGFQIIDAIYFSKWFGILGGRAGRQVRKLTRHKGKKNWIDDRRLRLPDSQFFGGPIWISRTMRRMRGRKWC